jgi:hypothetical protein
MILIKNSLLLFFSILILSSGVMGQDDNPVDNIVNYTVHQFVLQYCDALVSRNPGKKPENEQKGLEEIKKKFGPPEPKSSPPPKTLADFCAKNNWKDCADKIMAFKKKYDESNQKDKLTNAKDIVDKIYEDEGLKKLKRNTIGYIDRKSQGGGGANKVEDLKQEIIAVASKYLDKTEKDNSKKEQREKSEQDKASGGGEAPVEKKRNSSLETGSRDKQNSDNQGHSHWELWAVVLLVMLALGANFYHSLIKRRKLGIESHDRIDRGEVRIMIEESLSVSSKTFKNPSSADIKIIQKEIEELTQAYKKLSEDSVELREKFEGLPTTSQDNNFSGARDISSGNRGKTYYSTRPRKELSGFSKDDFTENRAEACYQITVNPDGTSAKFEFMASGSVLKDAIDKQAYYITPVCRPPDLNDQPENISTIRTVESGVLELRGEHWILKKSATLHYA